MVNFGLVLRDFATPEWKAQYLDYEELKVLVDRIHNVATQDQEEFFLEVKKFQRELTENVTKINEFVKRMEKKYLERHVKLESQLEIFVGYT